MSYILLFDGTSGACVAACYNVEAALLIAAKLELNGWHTEEREPTVAELEQIFEHGREFGWDEDARAHYRANEDGWDVLEKII